MPKLLNTREGRIHFTDDDGKVKIAPSKKDPETGGIFLCGEKAAAFLKKTCPKDIRTLEDVTERFKEAPEAPQANVSVAGKKEVSDEGEPSPELPPVGGEGNENEKKGFLGFGKK